MPRSRGELVTLSIRSTVPLANGVPMPLLGLGTYKSVEPSDVRASVEAALEAGYRNIDTASMYNNEAVIGEVLAESAVPREELFIATKVWNDEQGYHSTLDAWDRSTERLGLDYLDLYLIHWPMADMYAETWRAMQELHADGRVRAIGVCNFLPPHLEALSAVADIGPMVDQVELHPYLQQPELQEYCATAGIVLQAWAPVMRGRVAEVPEIIAIAERHGVSPYQVSIRWVLQQGMSAIPKSVHPDRVRENADVFGFDLSAEEMAVMASLDQGLRVGRHPDSWGLT